MIGQARGTIVPRKLQIVPRTFQMSAEKVSDRAEKVSESSRQFQKVGSLKNTVFFIYDRSETFLEVCRRYYAGVLCPKKVSA